MKEDRPPAQVPLTPKHVTLNYLEWPFCVKLFCAGMLGALWPGFRSLATLKLVVNVLGDLYTEKNSCSIARIPCD